VRQRAAPQRRRLACMFACAFTASHGFLFAC